MNRYTGIYLIVLINLLYFVFVESFWYDLHAANGFLFSICLHTLVYLLINRFIGLSLNKSQLTLSLKRIYLFLLIIIFMISATGKYSWGSIPTPNLLISAFSNDLSLFKVLPFNPLPLVLVSVLMVIFFLKLIQKSSSPSKKCLNISIALCCLVLPSTYWFNAHLNSTRSHWFARNIVREDPFLGFILGDSPAIMEDKKHVVDNAI